MTLAEEDQPDEGEASPIRRAAQAPEGGSADAGGAAGASAPTPGGLGYALDQRRRGVYRGPLAGGGRRALGATDRDVGGSVRSSRGASAVQRVSAHVAELVSAQRHLSADAGDRRGRHRRESPAGALSLWRHRRSDLLRVCPLRSSESRGGGAA